MNPCSTMAQGYPTLGHPCLHHGVGLPFTGTHLISYVIVALLLLAVGIGLRRFNS